MPSGPWVAHSPNGRTPHSGQRIPGAVAVLTSDRVAREFTGDTAQLEDMAFSANGKYAVTGSQDDTARLWSVATGRQLDVFKGDTDSVPGVAISPNEQLVLTSRKDGTIRLWKTGLRS
jgi:WD40 repeat protein